MSYRLSILDKSPLAEGEHAERALQRTLALARQAESWGYHRFWLAEHHNSPRLASPAPEVLIPWLLAHTSHIRIGSGGVMLQHYSAYKVAETFNLLANLAPGRVDLGIGKAPGGLPLASRALQRGIDPALRGDFAEQLAELDTWLSAASPSTEDSDTLLATPLPRIPAQRFLLGASEESARLAARLGWHFVFAAHLNGDRSALQRIRALWRTLNSAGQFIVAVQAIVAANSQQAQALARPEPLWRVELENGQHVTVLTQEQAETFARQAESPVRRIEPREPSLLKGTAAQVHAELAALHQAFGIDEFIIDTPIEDGQARLTSLQLLAEYARPTAGTDLLTEEAS
ncbi:LLM class flavin-dependent oxidoreductase [Gibbsiella greigii]